VELMEELITKIQG